MKTYINGNCIEQILTNAVELTQAEYNALSTEQKNHGTYIITDAESPDIPATDVEYSTGVTVKDKIDSLLSWTYLDDLTSGGEGVDVSDYHEVFIIPKMQGWAMQNPIIMIIIPNTRTSQAAYVNTTYGFEYAINFSTSKVLTITDQTLRGWTSATYAIYAR